jgi:hypothetical protein
MKLLVIYSMEKIFRYLINTIRRDRPSGVLWDSFSKSQKESFGKKIMTHEEYIDIRDGIFG